ncbi:MAG TPA: amidohydrolase family protein [Steroidobacteraceae bacterium]|nr:amidohydrolase family protein [Steroidobacteraceae bacterium]
MRPSGLLSGFVLLCLAQPAVAADPAAAPPVAPCPDAAEAGRVFPLAIGGNRAGYHRECRLADGAGFYIFEFNDRGRGPSLRSRILLDAEGVPTAITVDGSDYLKGPIAERFAIGGGKASWRNKVETGERAAAGRAFYLSQSGTPAELPLLAKAALASPGGAIALLPSGEARAEVLEERSVKSGDSTVVTRLVALYGLGYQPTAVWLDAKGDFFASVDSWVTLVPEGWESVAPELLAAQEARLSALRREQAARLRQVAKGPFLIEHANVFDAEAGRMKPGSSVLVDGTTIRAVGADGTIDVPTGTERVDAKGRALVPGLWDMHSHPEPADGLLLLAGGVTGVRDMAAEPSKKERMGAWDTGETLGPRIAYAGIVDGPGPFQGPTPVLVATEAEARSAVDAMADAGFILVKIYSSVKPELVPAIADQAAKRGLRVGGHIPAFMTADRAVRAGYDEIQHMNMLFLNFMFDRVQDTRTPARLTAVADGAADLDFDDAKTKDFVALLASERVTVDPTLQLFENLILDRPGKVATAYLPIADRLPPVVRRGLLEGGLPATPDKEPRYASSFAAMLRMLGVLHAAGVPIVAGTDSLGGFALVRELELYVKSGIPAPEVLRMATLGAARAVGQGERLGSIEPGKLADFILVDGDPSTDPGALRNLQLVVKDGVRLEPEAMWRELGIQPLPGTQGD